MVAVENLLGGAVLDAARITGMPVIDLVGALVAGQNDVAGIDYHDVVTAIHMRRVGRFVLAAEPLRDQHGEAADHEAFCVDQEPGLLDVFRAGGKGLHGSSYGQGSALLTACFASVKR